MAHPVGIMGGMGPAAGADFLRLFVQACGDRLRAASSPVVDQAYPEHWLAQLPVPDRSAALADANAPQPLEAMTACLARLAAMGVRTVAIACNTAHAWHPQLQSAFPDVRVLHAMDEVAAELALAGTGEVGLLATQGTYAAGLYQQALSRRGILCAVPRLQEREALMQGIYQGVKAGRLAQARELIEGVARALVSRHDLQVLILGCTEIPLALPDHVMPWVKLVDPARLLARRLAAAAYGCDDPSGR